MNAERLAAAEQATLDWLHTIRCDHSYTRALVNDLYESLAEVERLTARLALVEHWHSLEHGKVERLTGERDHIADVLESVVQGMDEPDYEFDPVDDGQVIRNIIAALRREALAGLPDNENESKTTPSS